MTVDREQVRRDDARQIAANLAASLESLAETTRDVIDVLLAELEQAETEVIDVLLAELEQAETEGIDHAVYEAVCEDRDRQEQRALQAERERDEARLAWHDWQDKGIDLVLRGSAGR